VRRALLALALAVAGCDHVAHEHAAQPAAHDHATTTGHAGHDHAEPTATEAHDHAAAADHAAHDHAAPAAHDHAAGQGTPELPETPAANPVQAEMRLLTAALEGTVRGIGLGDVRGVQHDLHRVHAARAQTEAALHDGRYRPPSHADQLERFVELDEAFHAELETLAAASARNDVPATAEALGRVTSRCQGCHAEFRPR
jgi:hypothetical protein